MTEAVAAVVRDTRLTPDAVRVILDVALRGEGEHELSHTHFSILLNHQGGTRRVSRALSLATELGWIERTPGGRGHSDRYEFSPPEFDGPKYSPPESSTPIEDSPPSNGRAKTDSRTEFGGAKEPAGGTVGGEVVEGDGEGGTPSVSPPQLATVAEHAIEDYGDTLSGCRDALRDYVAANVEAGNQLGYVHTVAAWVKGGDEEVWRLPGDGLLPGEKRPGMVAVALNELAAGDEKDMKGSRGHTRNLRTKISALLSQRRKNGRPHGGSNRGKGSGEEDWSIGRNQGVIVPEA